MGAGFRVQSVKALESRNVILGIRVQGSGSGFRIQGLWFSVQSLVFIV